MRNSIVVEKYTDYIIIRNDSVTVVLLELMSLKTFVNKHGAITLLRLLSISDSVRWINDVAGIESDMIKIERETFLSVSRGFTVQTFQCINSFSFMKMTTSEIFK